MGNGIILKSKTATAMECLQFALNESTSVVITGIGSIKILDQACEAARSFKPMSRKAREALLAKTRQAAAKGEYELFKTRSIFDSTAQNPEWLGEEPNRIADLMPV